MKSDESACNGQIPDDLIQAGNEILRSTDKILFGRRENSHSHERNLILCQFKRSL
jgi:hypothetical protein